MNIPNELVLGEDFPTPEREQWLELVDKVLRGRSFDDVLVSTTYDDIRVEPIYTRDGAIHRSAPGRPGFARAVDVMPPSGGEWDIRQRQANADPAAANREMLLDLERGVTSLELVLDIGGRGDVDGIVVADVDDLDRLLQDVLLDLAPVAISAGPSAVAAANLLGDLWERRGVDAGQRRGCLGLDPLGALARHGTVVGGLDAAYDAMAELIDRHAASPDVRPLVVDTGAFVDAGASDGQELAAMLGAGAEYLRALTARGVALDDAAGSIELVLTAGVEVFPTIAKLRAARRAWSHLVESAGAAPEATAPLLTVRTATPIMSRRDPWVNMLRTTAACFGAAVGGASAVTVLPFDAAIGPSNELARRIARNTQLLLAEESHVAEVLDPAGGSWYVESLTESLIDVAWERFTGLERHGGLAVALADGSADAELAVTRERRAADIATRRRPITGVSEFPDLAEDPVERIAPDVDALRAAAVSRTKVVEPAGPAATVSPLTEFRVPAAFEALRDASDAELARVGARPSIFLANLGPVATHTARATFASNFFEAGGIETIGNDGFADADAVAEAFAASGATAAVICSSDELYAEHAAATAEALVAAGATWVALAGAPRDHEAAWRSAGVVQFVHIGVDALAVLSELHRHLGIDTEVGQ